jgi:hypothetical protein
MSTTYPPLHVKSESKRLRGQTGRRIGGRSGSVPALDVLRFQSFLTRDNVKDDLVALIQGFETLPQNRGMMDENILAGVLSNKAKPSLIIEPFYFATGHILS